MLPLEKIFEKARSQPRHIVLAEGEDPRVIQAALCAEQEKNCAYYFAGVG